MFIWHHTLLGGIMNGMTYVAFSPAWINLHMSHVSSCPSKNVPKYDSYLFGWVIFASYFLSPLPGHFFGVMALSDHKYSLSKIIWAFFVLAGTLAGCGRKMRVFGQFGSCWQELQIRILKNKCWLAHILAADFLAQKGVQMLFSLNFETKYEIFSSSGAYIILSC